MAYADPRLRCIAAMIDLLVLLVVVVRIAVGCKQIAAVGLAWPAFVLGAGAGTALAYLVVLEARYGWTIGKRLPGLRVVMLEGGGRPDWCASIVRNVPPARW